MELRDNIDIYKCVKNCLAGGHILGVYTECDRLYAENKLKELVRDYRITKKVFPSKTENTEDIVSEIAKIEDDVRLVIVFGGYNIIECTRSACTLMGINYIIVQTEGARILDDKAYIFKDNMLEIRGVMREKAYLVDKTSVLRKANIEYLIGDIVERLLVVFDEVYMNVVEGRGVSDTALLERMLHDISALDENDKGKIVETAYSLECSTPHIISYISHQIAYHDESGRDAHSYKFSMAYILLLMYRGYIAYDGDDLLYPPDIVGSAKVLSRVYGMDITSLVLSFKMMTTSEYMRTLHIEHEYREELVTLLDRCIAVMKNASKVYRRIAKDVGYRMYEGVRLDDLESAISLFAIVEEKKTPLRMMKIGGFLERYITK